MDFLQNNILLIRLMYVWKAITFLSFFTLFHTRNDRNQNCFPISLDVAKFRLYKPVQKVPPEETPTRDFLKLDFKNKGLEAFNISNILNHKKVTETIPAYFKNRAHHHLLQLFVSHCT